MNRRNFIGAAIGSLAAAKLGTEGVYPIDAQAASALTENAGVGAPQQGSWIKNGYIDAGGDHEPYIFVVRRGGEKLNAHEYYEYEQSEELMRKLKSQGVEVFHTHFYKGFGMAAEKQGMEDAIRTAAIAHRLGMKVDNYLQWDSMMYETFFAEEPRAKDWIQCDQWGQPIMLSYGYEQSFRYRPCFSNQEYLDYLKQVVRYAVVKVKTDFIHFDNFDLNSEPESCHCNGCKRGFRNYLKTKYSDQQRKQRFGFVDVDYVNPPLWNRSNPPEKLDIIFDPGFQEWIDYRCQVMSDALRQMAELIRSLNPEVVIEINSGGVVGQNNPWTRGCDYRRLMPYTQVFVSEQDARPEYLPDGRLITSIRTYKMARTYHNFTITDFVTSSEQALGERLAFTQTLGSLGSSPLSPEVLKYISFYRKNRDLYARARDVASVAVFRSYPSITYHNSGAGLSAILVEQTLIQAKIPFHLIFEEQLSHLSPTTCEVLILPNSECLSDEQIAMIRQYVETGGGLVATEHAGLYDNWRRLRVKPGLEGLIDHQLTAQAFQEEVRRTAIAAGTAVPKRVGRGRVVYIPGLEFDGPLPPPRPYFRIDTAFWKRPKNWRQLTNAISWASRGKSILQVAGPDYLGVNLVEQMDKQRRLVHMVNYNAANMPSIENIEVKCVVPEGKSANAVRWYSADLDTYRTLDFGRQGSQTVFVVPELRAYGLAAIDW